MAKSADLRNPLLHFLIALAAAAAGSLASYVIHGDKGFSFVDALVGLIIALSIQISFLTYEVNLVTSKIHDLYPFVDGPRLARASSLITLLRSIPEINKDALVVTFSDVSTKGKIWLDILRHAEALDSTCCLDPSDWSLTPDGQGSLKIQDRRISDRELKVRRIFILREEDKSNSKYREHLDAQVSIGVEARWIGAEEHVASDWIKRMKHKPGSPDISLFTIDGQELLYWTELDAKNREMAGHYRIDGFADAQSMFNELFNHGRKIETLGRPHNSIDRTATDATDHR
jgi:hypothetical protein